MTEEHTRAAVLAKGLECTLVRLPTWPEHAQGYKCTLFLFASTQVMQRTSAEASNPTRQKRSRKNRLRLQHKSHMSSAGHSLSISAR